MEWTAAEAHGNRELQGVSEALVRSFSKRTGQIDAELDRLAAHGRERTGADAAAGQVGRPGYAQAQAARDPGHPI
jgi:hypothetical protein